jgi:hypothetical protein
MFEILLQVLIHSPNQEKNLSNTYNNKIFN